MCALLPHNSTVCATRGSLVLLWKGLCPVFRMHRRLRECKIERDDTLSHLVVAISFRVFQTFDSSLAARLNGLRERKKNKS